MKKENNDQLVSIAVKRTDYRQFYDSNWDVEISLPNKTIKSHIVRDDLETENSLSSAVLQIIESKLNVFSQIKHAWSADTAHPSYADKWSKENPSTGQCYATAHNIFDIYGGDIISCKVGRNTHFYNRLFGINIDLTKDQFGKDSHIEYNHEKLANKLISSSSCFNRYMLIKRNIVLDFDSINEDCIKSLDQRGSIYYD